MIPERLIYQNGILKILDQRLIPYKISYLKAKTYKEVAKAIKDMVLRGAPLIGCAAAYAYVIGFKDKNFKTKNELLKYFRTLKENINSSRPTALALFAASDRIQNLLEEELNKSSEKLDFKDNQRIREKIYSEALKIVNEDIDSTYKMAEYGIKLLNKNSRVITYCNTGALATMGIGTALGVITYGYKKGKISFAYSCETRPYMQGTRLTIWELKRNKIPSALITDNMSSYIMATEKIDAVLIGADRIAANGDTANKIGSYQLAIAARYHNIPFYVVAPTPTFDTQIENGSKIKIEERSEREVVEIMGKKIAPEGIKARHPAFDVTPHNLIKAIITEKGIITPVNQNTIKKHLS